MVDKVTEYHVFAYDPLSPIYGWLGHQLTQRVQQHAQTHLKETDASFLTRQLFGRITAGDADVILLVVATAEGQIVAHALASVVTHGSKRLVFTYQWQVDVKETGQLLIDELLAYARLREATHLHVQTDKEAKYLQKTYGFKVYQAVLSLPVEEPKSAESN